MTSRVMAQETTQITDETLVEAAQAGDHTAFGLLVSRYRSIAYSYAYASLQNREEAEDVTQEAFIRAMQGLPRFRSKAYWGAWLMRILRNLCTDTLRKRKRSTLPITQELPDPTPSPEFATLNEAQKRALRIAVGQLPEKYRTPLLMHYASGHTYREIALSLNLSESTVTGRLAGALRILRRKLLLGDEK